MARNPDLPRNLGIGCFVTPLGAASGAMVGVLLSVVVAYFTKAPACTDMPSCDWYKYAGVGAVLGGLSLPLLVLRRLFQRPADPARRDEPATAVDADKSF